MRTTTSSVTFQAPFTINKMVGELPAGTYDIEVDEEPIFLDDRMAYRRIATLLLVRAPGSTRTIRIEPEHLETAMQTDARAARGE